MTSPVREELEKAAKEVLAAGGESDLTLRVVRGQVEKKLGLAAGRLSEEDWKQKFRAIVVGLMEKRAGAASPVKGAAKASAGRGAGFSKGEKDDKEDEEEENEEEKEEEEEEEAPPRKKSKKEGKKETKKESKPRARKRKAEAPAKKDKDPLAKLRELGRAMSLGPRIYVGLKDLPADEAFTTLADRLREAGATFKGKLPTAQDISAAKKKADLAKSLDGIDTGLIIADTSRRRRAADAGDAARKEAAKAAAAAAKAMASSSEEKMEEDEDDEDDEDGDEEEEGKEDEDGEGDKEKDGEGNKEKEEAEEAEKEEEEAEE